MNLQDIPFTDIMYIIPSDIQTVIKGILAFLFVLAIWRIIK